MEYTLHGIAATCMHDIASTHNGPQPEGVGRDGVHNAQYINALECVFSPSPECKCETQQKLGLGGKGGMGGVGA